MSELRSLFEKAQEQTRKMLVECRITYLYSAQTECNFMYIDIEYLQSKAYKTKFLIDIFWKLHFGKIIILDRN